jgi:hypothetical protein
MAFSFWGRPVARVDTARACQLSNRKAHVGPSEAFQKSAKSSRVPKRKIWRPRMPTFSQYPRDDRVDAAQEIALGDPSAE